MIRLWNKIDLLVGPDQATRELAKMQVPVDDTPGYQWNVCELDDGSIQYWRDTNEDESIITVTKRIKKKKRKGKL